jgi:hypothetical protein
MSQATNDSMASVDPGYLSKRTRESFHTHDRKRGRRQEGDT